MAMKKAKKPMRGNDDGIKMMESQKASKARRDARKSTREYNSRVAGTPKRGSGSGSKSSGSPLQVSPVGSSRTGWSRSKPTNIPKGYRLMMAASNPPKYKLVKDSRSSR